MTLFAHPQATRWAVAGVLLLAPLAPATADDPWIISEPTVVDAPMRVGDVIVVSGGRLEVRDLPEPGLELAGNLWVVGDGEAVLTDSVIQFLSTYHGQYALATAEQGSVEVRGCDYRVPNGVQHALLATGNAKMTVTDTDFGDVQLIVAGDARFDAERLDGSFEVIVQGDATMRVADIPRQPAGGRLWVWVEVPEGAEVVYTPPMPGFVESWTYPPEDAVGVAQRVEVERCETLLWPLLVRPDSRLVLRDIPEENWVVVGFHLPASATVSGLSNGLGAADAELDLSDRVVRLENASIDTFNLYPEDRARVVVRDCWLGEILAMGASSALVERTLVDGTGGFFGARDHATIVARDSTFTCTVEAAQDARIALHRCSVEPYSIDPTGAFTRFGAYDRAMILADATPVETTPALGGQGLIAVSWLTNPPASPPPPGTVLELEGTVGLFSLEDGPAPGSWRLEAVPRWGRRPRLLGSGEGNVELGRLGVWTDADPSHDYLLRIILVDRWGRSLVGERWVPGEGLPPAASPRRGARPPAASGRTGDRARAWPLPRSPATGIVRGGPRRAGGDPR